MSSDRSTPRTRRCGPTSTATCSVGSPMPQPRSSTRLPSPICAVAAMRSATGQVNDWKSGSQRRQPPATACHAARASPCSLAMSGRLSPTSTGENHRACTLGFQTVRARMPFLSHDGVSLRYDRTGSGSAVLLVHGWTGNRTFWERQVQALRDRHTVIAVDLRGHGESSHPRSGYAIGKLTGDLEHLVRALAVPRIAIVGWSMGGMVATELARRLGERASALVLVGTS